MGIFSSLFGHGESNGGSSEATFEVQTLVCDSCGRDVPEDEMDGDYCHDCLDEVGTAYCCGMIYEDGETTCRSCGEPL